MTILLKRQGGTVSLRAIPHKIWYGTTTWQPGEQWFVDVFDLEGRSYRTIAMIDILEWQVGSANVPVRSGAS